jgi:hypothetical protein
MASTVVFSASSRPMTHACLALAIVGCSGSPAALPADAAIAVRADATEGFPGTYQCVGIYRTTCCDGGSAIALSGNYELTLTAAGVAEVHNSDTSIDFTCTGRWNHGGTVTNPYQGFCTSHDRPETGDWFACTIPGTDCSDDFLVERNDDSTLGAGECQEEGFWGICHSKAQ